MYLFLLACLIICASAAPQNYYNPQQYQYSRGPVIPIVAESNEINPDGSFSYSYSTGDGQQAQAQGYVKSSGIKDQEAQVIQGAYSYTAPDGTPISVRYIADENGFRAEGAHLPTPPPVPEAIQKSLDLIAQTQRLQPLQPQYPYNRPF